MTKNDNNNSLSIDRELDWDIREERIAQIGQLVVLVRSKQMDAQQNKTSDALRDYHTALYSLYLDIRPYLERYGTNDDENTIGNRLKDIDRRLQEPSAVNNGKILRTLRGVDKELNEKRIEAGLDIPVSKHIEYGESRGDNE